jgi:hypothetical protein
MIALIPINASVRTTLRMAAALSLSRERVKPPRQRIPNVGMHSVKDDKLEIIRAGGWEHVVYRQSHDGFTE